MSGEDDDDVGERFEGERGTHMLMQMQKKTWCDLNAM
jgi:hypothetical protein